MELDEVLDILIGAIAEKLPNADIAAYGKSYAPYFVVLSEDINFEVALTLRNDAASDEEL